MTNEVRVPTQTLEKRYTKDFAETYEVVPSRSGFREFYILYPKELGDPFIGDFYEIADELESKHILISVYPMSETRPETKDIFLSNSPILHEVLL
jgi:hypothetical protein